MRAQTKWLACTAPAGTGFDTPGAPQAVYMFAGPGRIRRIELHLPPGSAGELHVVPYVVGRSKGRTSAIQFSAGGDQYLSGDDAVIPMEADFPVQTGDVIEAWYQNTDAANPHWFGMAVTWVPDGGVD